MQDVNQLHDRAIQLWIHAKSQNESKNPAEGIFFALTNQSWPQGVPVSQNAIDLCNVLSTALGHSPLMAEQTQRLNARAVLLFEQHKAGATPLQTANSLIWGNRLGYVLGLASFLIAGFSWWVAVLMLAVWWCYGTARTAARMASQETRPTWEAPTIAIMHIAALIALLGFSVARIALA